MLANPVVPREVQSKHRIVVAVLLAVGIREPSEPADLHPGRQIEPLHAAGADLSFRHIATDHLLLD